MLVRHVYNQQYSIDYVLLFIIYVYINLVSVVHNGYLYIFGGFNRNLDVHFQDLNRYDPETSTWTKILPKGKPPCPRRRQICLLVNNRVFISGGTSPILPNPTIMRLNTYEESVQNLNQLKDHDDLHVLDLSIKYFPLILMILNYKY